MKNLETNNDIVQVIILDILGVYAHIHDQSYCDREKLEKIKARYSDTNHWKIVVLDFM